MRFITAASFFLGLSLVAACSKKTPTSEHVLDIVLPKAFIGIWDSSQSACVKEQSLTRLTISEKNVRYWESQGEVTKIIDSGINTVAFELSMTDDGENRVETIKYQLANSGTELVETLGADGGETYTRFRCR